jgi:dolichyl-phosphate-mannose-protein mannosyltransferase
MPTLLARLNRPIVAILAVAAIAGAVRFVHLSQPSGFVFDEIYYPKAGCIYLGWSDKTCRIDSSDERFWRTEKWDVGSWVHPPLGKWTIAVGIKAFGMNEFGWRVMSALAGTLVAVMVAMMAQLLFDSPLWAFVGGLLISIEHLNVVMSRVGLLDVHLEFWITLGFLCVLLDRRWIDRRTPGAAEGSPPLGSENDDTDVGGGAPEPPREAAHRLGGVPSPLWRPWRFAAGAALGAACAVKWSGITAVAAAVFLAYLWETTRRHRGATGRGRAFLRTFAMETLGITLAFLVVPVVVYMTTWIPWFNHFGWSFKSFWQDTVAMWDYHKNLKEFAYDSITKHYTPTHPYYSRPWSWIPMLRPVSFYVQNQPGGGIRQIVALGSPAIFWGSLGSLPYAGFAWRRKRDWRPGFALMTFLFLYLPWFAVSRPQFFFYVLPSTPFMVLALTYALRDLAEARIVLRDRETGEVATNPDTGQPAISTQHPYRWIAWAFVIAALGLFIWFWPVLTAGPLSHAMWRARVWFRGWV